MTCVRNERLYPYTIDVAPRPMKIRLETSTLSRELFKLQGIVAAKSTLPILHNALFEAKADGTLHLHATDLDISVSTEVACEVETPGRVTVKAKDLYDAVKNLKSDTVSLEKEDNLWVMLKAGTVKARFVGMNPDEFPQVQKAEEVQFLPIDTQKMLRMIERTIFSVSTDEGRPNLTGAMAELTSEGVLRMVSTDGHRLSMAQTRVAEDGSGAPEGLGKGIIIPRKGLAELRRTVDPSLDSLAFGISGNNAVFRYGNTTLFVRIIDGTFPNFQQVIPQEDAARKALVNRAEMIDRLKFVSLFSSSRTHNLRLVIEDDTCTISAQDPDKGECEEQIPVTYSGPAVRAGFNYRYILDVLGVINGDDVSIEVIDTLSPTIIRETEGEDDDDSLFIVMPMRI